MSVKRDIVANYLGNAWVAIVQIAFVPLYIRYLGIEAFGLIGIFASLQVLMSFLDVGMTPTLTREMTRFKAGLLPIGEARALLRTVQLIFTGVAVIIFICICSGSRWLAADWLKAEALPVATVSGAIGLMGASIALRWLSGIYRGVITGLQHLVWLNSMTAAFATLRGIGVLLVLALISPSVDAFFLYQACVSLIELMVLSRKSWSLIASHESAAFSADALRRIWRFSTSVSMIALLGLVLMQSDKILLSKLLPLREFGYYALASSVAGSLGLLILPISGVAYPRLTELVARENPAALADAYHRFAQLLTLILAPSALVLALFSDRILMLWIQDAVTVGATAHLVSLLAVGVMLNGFMNTPNNLQLAYGNTTFMIALYSVVVLVFVPALFVGVSAFGAVAAGYAWIAVNAGCILLAVPLMHRRLLPREQARWFRQDVGLPATAAFVAAYAVFLLAPAPSIEENWANFTVVALASLLAFAAAAFACPLGRETVARGWSHCIESDR